MEKKSFIARELWILAWDASVQRANLYRQGINSISTEKSTFRNKVINYLSSEVIPEYKNKIDEERHYKNIKGLISFANKENDGLLSESGYKYGVAQKLLNLILKYYWCIDLIEEPPHCPVDRIIIGKTRYRGQINWTQILKEQDYKKIIDDIRLLASRRGLSIPMWELSIFNRR